MIILGINAAWHDPAACIVRDGEVLAAAEEERFTGVKHGKRWGVFNTAPLPFHAVHACLEAAGIGMVDVDHVAYSVDPTLLQHKFPSTGTLELPRNPTTANEGWLSEELWWTIYAAGIVDAPHLLVDDVPWHLRGRWYEEMTTPAPETAEAGLTEGARQHRRSAIDVAQRRRGHDWQFHWVEHHLAHAASAYFPSPFERAAILTLDGMGELVSTVLGVGVGDDIELLRKVEWPNSLGKLYERVTTHLGFLSTSDEYKVMALASYGKPRFAEAISEMFSWPEPWRYEIADVSLDEVLGPPRARHEALQPEHFDIAASVQAVLEESALRLAHWLHEETGADDLCLAGGVALNCVMNSRLVAESPFRRAWTQPAAGDAGTALGAALAVWHRERPASPRWRMHHAYLGPEFSAEEIERALVHAKAKYRRSTDVAADTAAHLAAGRIVGWFQGRMEFGPRALGARSILASPCEADMMQRLNELKDREDFRPVAPAVAAEHAAEYFDGCTDAPFMTFVYQVRAERAGEVPAIRHVDGTARVQTVTAEDAPRYHRLIEQFHALTGVPVVVNTSFNSRGRPVVCTPQDALECFFTSPIDVLAIGDFILEK